MRGIVWTGKLEIRDDLAVRSPGDREVMVRIANAGLCHSDVSVLNGTIPFPTPVVLGHEGAGVVEEVGRAVTSVNPGDHVVLTTFGNCGQCDACDRGLPTHCRHSVGGGTGMGRYKIGGNDSFQFANLGVFSERTVVFETQCVRIDPDVPFESACLIGCAVLTGTGEVLHRAKVQPGQTVAVIGVGGVGQSVIQGARLSSARRVVAIDTNPAKEVAARKMGATDFIDASTTQDTVTALRDLGLPNGVDYAFECVGHPTLIRQAVSMLDWGGSCIMLGVPKLGTTARFVVSDMYNDKSIVGCRHGSTKPHHDIPLVIDLYKSGRFYLDEMVSQVYDLAAIRDALSDLDEGKLNRAVLRVAP
jgi:Zn-dependent alcohol dehydrogenase